MKRLLSILFALVIAVSSFAVERSYPFNAANADAGDTMTLPSGGIVILVDDAAGKRWAALSVVTSPVTNQVANIAALRTANRAVFSADVVRVVSYSATVESGGGDFRYLGDTAATDDGLVIITDASGDDWRRMGTHLSPEMGGIEGFQDRNDAGDAAVGFDVTPVLHKILAWHETGDFEPTVESPFYSQHTPILQANTSRDWKFNAVCVSPAATTMVMLTLDRAAETNSKPDITWAGFIRGDSGLTPDWYTNSNLPDGIDRNDSASCYAVMDAIDTATDVGVSVRSFGTSKLRIGMIRGLDVAMRVHGDSIANPYITGCDIRVLFAYNCRVNFAVLQEAGAKFTNENTFQCVQGYYAVPPSDLNLYGYVHGTVTGGTYGGNENNFVRGDFEVSTNQDKLICGLVHCGRGIKMDVRLDSQAYTPIMECVPEDGDTIAAPNDCEYTTSSFSNIKLGQGKSTIRTRGNTGEHIVWRHDVDLIANAIPSGADDLRIAGVFFQSFAATTTVQPSITTNFVDLVYNDGPPYIKNVTSHYRIGVEVVRFDSAVDDEVDVSREGHYVLSLAGNQVRFECVCYDGDGNMIEAGTITDDSGDSQAVGTWNGTPFLYAATGRQYIPAYVDSGSYAIKFHPKVSRAQIFGTSNASGGKLTRYTLTAINDGGQLDLGTSTNAFLVDAVPQWGRFDRSKRRLYELEGSAGEVGLNLETNGVSWATGGTYVNGATYAIGDTVDYFSSGFEIWRATTAGTSTGDDPEVATGVTWVRQDSVGDPAAAISRFSPLSQSPGVSDTLPDPEVTLYRSWLLHSQGVATDNGMYWLDENGTADRSDDTWVQVTEGI